MLDLKKYTRFRQLEDKLNEFSLQVGLNTSSEYIDERIKCENEYSELYDYCSGKLDLPINLYNYIQNLRQYLNKKHINGGGWLYRFHEIEHRIYECEYFSTIKTYHDYLYQVELLNGNKIIPVCTVNRKLNYNDREATINLLHDEIYPSFSLRLDKTCDEFDEKTNIDLKKIYIKTYIEDMQAQINKEKTLIQQDIKRLEWKYQEKEQECDELQEQINELQVSV